MNRPNKGKTAKARHLVGSTFFAAGASNLPRPGAVQEAAEEIAARRARPKPQSEAARLRVEKFMRGESPTVDDPDEAAGLSPSSYKFALGGRGRSEPVAGGFAPVEPPSPQVLREISVDLLVGRRRT